MKHKNTQPLYIFSRVRVLHLKGLRSGLDYKTLHSFDQVLTSRQNVNSWCSLYWHIRWSMQSTNVVEVSRKIVHRLLCINGILLLKLCSDLLWEKNVLMIEKNLRNSRLKTVNLQKKVRSFNPFRYSNSERLEQFLVTDYFFPGGFSDLIN